MRIGLIAMSGVRVRTAELAALGVTLPGFVQRGKVIASLPSLGLLTVAGLTPERHRVTYLEVSDVRAVGELQEFDLVGISSYSAQIDEAYELADRYREKGIPVVLGGPHVTAAPEEAMRHADAVVTGGAEGAWRRLLLDFEAGRPASRYDGAREGVFGDDCYAMPRFELLGGRSYNRITVQTTRGCPRRCEFCASSIIVADRANLKPVEKVIAEIREAKRWHPQPFFELADDNTFIDPAWSKAMLRELAREEIHYFTETDASIADHPDLMDLLAESGCRQILIGFESPRPDDLEGIDPAGWKKRRAPRMRQAIEALQSRGISVNGCFVLGLDNQTPEVFPQILQFVRSSGLAEVQYTVLTPFPGTPLYERLRREGRLLREKAWDRCTLFDVNFRPARMTVEELEAGLRWLFEETYTAEATAARRRSFAAQAYRGRRERAGA